MDKRTFYAALFAACLLMLAVWCFQMPNGANVAEAYSVEDLVNYDVVRFYEKSIAEEDFITGMSESRRERMCETYSVSNERLNLILILQDLGARTGDKQNLSELSRMNDRQISSCGKKLVKAYISTLSDERKEKLKQEWKERKSS